MMRITLLFALATLSISSLHAEENQDISFCERNPDARVCMTRFDVRREEKKQLEDECRVRPNTERCKNKRTADKVRDERVNFCQENPKACAARRMKY
jgi:hypothetical protein